MEGSYISGRANSPMIDHMKLHKDTTDYIFGTTRTHQTPYSPGTGSNVYIFMIKLTSDHKIDNSSPDNLNTVRIDMETKLGVDSRITGISNEMKYHDFDNGHGIKMVIDIIVFNPTEKQLWYVRAGFDTWYLHAYLLNGNIDYVRESIFAGTNTGRVQDWLTHDWF